MRATTIHAARDIRVEDVDAPTITEPHQAVVQVTAGCVCGSDLWPYRGANQITVGDTMGHECVGVVTEVGAEVRGFTPGDFVIVPFCHCDNTCPHCAFGVQSACVNLGFTDSGQAEFATVQQADGSLVRAEPTADERELRSLLALTDVMATGWHAAIAAGVRSGGTVAVVGDGAVGLCGVLAAHTLGAERIIAMSRHEPRQAVARRFGATDVVAERGDEGQAAVAALTDGVGVDAVLECVGTDDSMTTALRLARPGGGIGFVGVPHDVGSPVSRMFRRNVGLRGGVAPVRGYLPDLLARVVDGTLDPSPVFDLTLPLEEAPAAYAAMDERRAIKVMLRP